MSVRMTYNSTTMNYLILLVTLVLFIMVKLKICRICQTYHLKKMNFFLIAFKSYTFHGRVHELLINPEKTSTSSVFEENVERFLCLRFSITRVHDLYSLDYLFHSQDNLCSSKKIVKNRVQK